MKRRRLHRFKIQITQIFILVSVFWFLVSEGYAQAIPSTELINNAKQLDAKTVTFEGEVIGDIMQRGDFAWVNVNDGKNAIGVWAEAVLLSGIAYTGTYKAQGDWVKIVGTFNRACKEHGGDLDIHALSVHKIKDGHPITEVMDTYKRNLALFMCALAGILWILNRLKRQ
jgi:hypothetical protein